MGGGVGDLDDIAGDWVLNFYRFHSLKSLQVVLVNETCLRMFNAVVVCLLQTATQDGQRIWYEKGPFTVCIYETKPQPQNPSPNPPPKPQCCDKKETLRRQGAGRQRPSSTRRGPVYFRARWILMTVGGRVWGSEGWE